jgi:endoglycosylceramidase
MDQIRISGNRFVDGHGRQIILSGINLVFKGKRLSDGDHRAQQGKTILGDDRQWMRSDMNYIAPWTEADFAHLRDWGFNVVRLGLIWDAVEPQPGFFDKPYLDWIGSMLDLCEQYGLYAFLDMHQDLFSVLYSDGAPAWATLTDGLPHVSGDLWSDAYLESEAVQRAFDHFWANTVAADGIGLQDHYINMWVHVARRFSGYPALIGYDFLNEPYPGSAGRLIFANLLGAFADLISSQGGQTMSFDDMMATFSDPEAKFMALGYLEDRTFYESLAKAVEPMVAEFDLGDLDLFYRRMSNAVRAVDRSGIIFRENSYFSNMGIECLAEPIQDETGNPVANQIFSPHGYDLVVDSEAIVLASNRRVDVIFAAHRRAQERMQVPVLVGEWGAHGWYADGLDHIAHILSLFERNLWSQTYWCYESGFSLAPVLQILKRPYPQAVCVILETYAYNRLTGEFTMTWNEQDWPSTDGESRIYLPMKPVSVTVDGPFRLVELAGPAEGYRVAKPMATQGTTSGVTNNATGGGYLLLLAPLTGKDTVVDMPADSRRHLSVRLE